MSVQLKIPIGSRAPIEGDLPLPHPLTYSSSAPVPWFRPGIRRPFWTCTHVHARPDPINEHRSQLCMLKYSACPAFNDRAGWLGLKREGKRWKTYSLTYSEWKNCKGYVFHRYFTLFDTVVKGRRKFSWAFLPGIFFSSRELCCAEMANVCINSLGAQDGISRYYVCHMDEKFSLSMREDIFNSRE